MSAAEYRVKKQWRAVGGDEFDVYFRDTENHADFHDAGGSPEPVWAVLVGPNDEATVIADCYSLKDAKRVRDALNNQPGP